MKRPFKWVLGLLSAIGAFIAILFFKATKAKKASSLAASLVESRHRPAIEKAQEEIKELSKDLKGNAEEIQKAKNEIAKRKGELVKGFAKTGLPPEEVVKRFRGMKVKI